MVPSFSTARSWAMVSTTMARRNAAAASAAGDETGDGAHIGRCRASSGAAA